VPTITVEIGTYEEGQVFDVEVPEITYEAAKSAFAKGADEVERLIEEGELEEIAHVVQLWHGRRCLYDYFNGFKLYWPEETKNEA
jgi:hypothetical protein